MLGKTGKHGPKLKESFTDKRSIENLLYRRIKFPQGKEGEHSSSGPIKKIPRGE